MTEIVVKYGDILRKNMLFEGLSDEELESALTKLDGSVSKYKKGDFLHSSGTPLKKFGFLLSGIIQVCMDDINGNRMIMANVAEGESFGESLSFLKVSESPVYIQAAESSEILWLSPAPLSSSSTDAFHSELKKRFTSLLANRTLAMNSRIQILSKLTLREKLLTYFSEISGKEKSRTFTVPFNRDDMAAFIGTNRSALSRELSRMKDDGILDYYKSTFRLLKN
ncbi:MAG: Crp/Fnr family transcriptional regulator [Spirochaetaceae bacterium]|nr:Crp/Fnr family transcriptional regulator [Spirochaetaceae bacterium]